MSQLLDPTHDKFIGVETLLKPGSRIIYETLFSMRHAGRVIDLILHEARDYFAKTSDVDASTARARHTLELLVLCAWSHYRLLENTRCLELEAGWDDEKIVFSVAGFVADGLGGLVPSLGAPANEVSGRLARYFGIVEETATMLALRHHKDIGFLQAYAVLAADAAAPRQTARVVELKKPEGYVPAPEFAAAGDDWLAAAAPLPKEPLGSGEGTEEFLGDERTDEAGRVMVQGRKEDGADGPVVINAKRALAGSEALELKPVEEGPLVDDTETLVSGGDFGPDTTETRVTGSAETPDETVTTVSGGDFGADDTETLVKGSAPEEDDSVTRIKGGIQEKSDDFKRVISGKKNLSKSDQEIIRVLQNSSSEEANEVAALLVEGAKAESVADEESQRKVQHIMKELESKGTETETAAASVEETVVRSGKELESHIMMAQKLMERVEMPDKVKQFLSDSLQKLSKNRADLNQKIKDINGQWLTAQLEFKNKQAALASEVAKSDVRMRIKDSALEKNKEVLARTLKSMEEYKQRAEQSGNAESAHKITQANMVASKAKDHALKLQGRVEEMQKKLSQETTSRVNLQSEKTKLEQQVEQLQHKVAGQDKNKSIAKEDPAMKAELDRANRQVDELKRQAKLLQDKLTVAQNPNKQSTAGAGKNNGGKDEPSDAELKHKLDAAQKMHAKLKEDNDKTVKRLDEAKQSETKLRVEIAKLQNELKQANKGAARKAS